MTRWWWAALGAVGFLAGRASAGPVPDRHWSERNGEDWRALGPSEQVAYTEGFLAGAAFGQAAQLTCPERCEIGTDSAGLQQTMATFRRNASFRLPFGANVYVSRVNDYYWWEDHRPFPLWYGFWEVNSALTGPMNDSTR